MKKFTKFQTLFIIVALAIVAAFTDLSLAKLYNANQFSHLYPLSTTVKSINTTTDTVAVEDYNGNLWEFYGTEDWEVGDRCSLIMNTNGTPSIYDDLIVSQKYDGRSETHNPDNWAMDYCESNVTIVDWNISENGNEIAFQLSDGVELYAEKQNAN